MVADDGVAVAGGRGRGEEGVLGITGKVGVFSKPCGCKYNFSFGCVWLREGLLALELDGKLLVLKWRWSWNGCWAGSEVAVWLGE